MIDQTLFEELEAMDLSELQPPLAFAAANAKFICDFPDGQASLWSADVKATRHGVFCRTFHGVLFAENPQPSPGVAAIFGAEHEDGYPRGVEATLATRQQAFIEFLRQENARDDRAGGWTRMIFRGHEYACLGKATAAYLVLRRSKMHMGVAYRNEDGEYVLEAVESADWTDHPYKSFDESR